MSATMTTEHFGVREYKRRRVELLGCADSARLLDSKLGNHGNDDTRLETVVARMYSAAKDHCDDKAGEHQHSRGRRERLKVTLDRPQCSLLHEVRICLERHAVASHLPEGQSNGAR